MARVPEVLVIDQDPASRFEFKRILRGAALGFAGEAGLGTEGVSLAAETTPDVILCGMAQPPERSLQTMEALMDVLPETPVIAYGRSDDVDAVRLAMQSGARDFLALPADTEKLIESVRKVLESVDVAIFAFDDQGGHASDIGVANFSGVTITLTSWGDLPLPPSGSSSSTLSLSLMLRSGSPLG